MIDSDVFTLILDRSQKVSRTLRRQGRNLAWTAVYVPRSLDSQDMALTVLFVPSSLDSKNMALTVLCVPSCPARGRRRQGESDPIRTSICHKKSRSTKVTTHLDRITHCKTASGKNWSNRWGPAEYSWVRLARRLNGARDTNRTHEYSVGPSTRPICSTCSFTMSNMIQVCSKFH